MLSLWVSFTSHGGCASPTGGLTLGRACGAPLWKRQVPLAGWMLCWGHSRRFPQAFCDRWSPSAAASEETPCLVVCPAGEVRLGPAPQSRVGACVDCKGLSEEMDSLTLDRRQQGARACGCRQSTRSCDGPWARRAAAVSQGGRDPLPPGLPASGTRPPHCRPSSSSTR